MASLHLIGGRLFSFYEIVFLIYPIVLSLISEYDFFTTSNEDLAQ